VDLSSGRRIDAPSFDSRTLPQLLHPLHEGSARDSEQSRRLREVEVGADEKGHTPVCFAYTFTNMKAELKDDWDKPDLHL
jgi:hypothetical protein